MYAWRCSRGTEPGALIIAASTRTPKVGRSEILSEAIEAWRTLGLRAARPRTARRASITPRVCSPTPGFLVTVGPSSFLPNRGPGLTACRSPMVERSAARTSGRFARRLSWRPGRDRSTVDVGSGVFVTDIHGVRRCRDDRRVQRRVPSRAFLETNDCIGCRRACGPRGLCAVRASL